MELHKLHEQAFRDETCAVNMMRFNDSIHLIAKLKNEEEFPEVIEARCKELAREFGLKYLFVMNKANSHYKRYFKY